MSPNYRHIRHNTTTGLRSKKKQKNTWGVDEERLWTELKKPFRWSGEKPFTRRPGWLRPWGAEGLVEPNQVSETNWHSRGVTQHLNKVRTTRYRCDKSGHHSGEGDTRGQEINLGKKDKILPIVAKHCQTEFGMSMDPLKWRWSRQTETADGNNVLELLIDPWRVSVTNLYVHLNK